jgi:hypothetical protein
MVAPLVAGLIGLAGGLGAGLFLQKPSVQTSYTTTSTYAPTTTKEEVYAPTIGYSPSYAITYPAYSVIIGSPMASIEQRQEAKSQPTLNQKPSVSQMAEAKPQITSEASSLFGLKPEHLILMVGIIAVAIVVYGVVSK